MKGLESEVGDRGNIVVNIPTSVLPYAPKLEDDYFYPQDYPEEYDYDRMEGDFSQINPVYVDNPSSVPNLRFSRDSTDAELVEQILAGKVHLNLTERSGNLVMSQETTENKMAVTHFKSENADFPIHIPKAGVQRSLQVIILKF